MLLELLLKLSILASKFFLQLIELLVGLLLTNHRFSVGALQRLKHLFMVPLLILSLDALLFKLNLKEFHSLLVDGLIFIKFRFERFILLFNLLKEVIELSDLLSLALDFGLCF